MMSNAAGALLWFVIGLPTATDVWLDVDTANGIGDVDDGLMMIQCFHSPELTVRGISVVFGNTTLDRAVPIAEEITERFGPTGLQPAAGAASADDLGKETDAVRALAHELAQRPLVILAVGPVTNVATLLERHPELEPKIQSIIMVAARRPGQEFRSSKRQIRPHPDANFDKDPRAMQRLLDSSVPLVFAPWEVSSHVWLTRDDLATLRGKSEAGRWIAESSQYWINLWSIGIDSRGFNPFDTLAAGWLTHPDLIESMPVKVRIIEDLDDRATPPEKLRKKTKPYLVIGPPEGEGRDAIYCVKPSDEFHDVLLERLAGPPATSGSN